MLGLNLQDGKTVDLSEIIDVHLEFDDPTLVLVRKSDIVNYAASSSVDSLVCLKCEL